MPERLLQGDGIRLLQEWLFRLPKGHSAGGLFIAERSTVFLIGVYGFGKGSIVDKPTASDGLPDEGFLFFGWIDTVFVCPIHTFIM